MKYIAVPSEYTVYAIADEVITTAGSGFLSQPPQVVMEMLIINGQAKRIGTIGTVELDLSALENGEEEEGLEGPWIGEDD